MLEFSVLASGSSGNSVYIKSESTKILLDAGISGKQLSERMASSSDAKLADIDALLITHEHIDHVRGLRQVVKQSKAKVYTTEGTWSQIGQSIPEERRSQDTFVKADLSFQIGDITVTPFAVSHDAEEPVAYRFDHTSGSLCVLTDVGYVSDHIKQVIKGCQSYVWESNHDVEMLRAGRYPWSVKRRILGDKGHLSNQDAAIALADILGTESVEVYLAHLSEENNMPELAEITFQSILRDIQPAYEEQVKLHRTSRHYHTSLTVV
ncbi:MBL fold metallo-hydrolase [Alicyclobacillus curvatus]|nr:MBL fold metallo-hydrolase [Alicyclobacillus curvatus]